MDWLEMVFLGSAIVGGTLFLLRTFTMIIGGLDFGDSDIPMDIDGDAGHALDMGESGMHLDGQPDHLSSEISFKFLSLQGLTAFFMMFGLVGLAIYRAEVWEIFSITGGVLAGLFTVWVIGMIFTLMRGLQSEGGNINMNNAIGQHGTVYLTIPENGSGQVQVVVQGSLKVLNAISSDNQKIVSKAKVKVVGIVDNDTLLVTKIN